MSTCRSLAASPLLAVPFPLDADTGRLLFLPPSALNYLSNLTSLATFCCWSTICYSFIRFKAACSAQGFDRSQTGYMYNRFQPFPAYWAITWCLLISKQLPSSRVEQLESAV